MQDNILITKATGEREPFDPEKLRASLTKARASEEVSNKIIERIMLGLKEGMSTKEIYAHAFELLAQEHKPAAVRYSLRKALLEMGPTGFPFEKLVAEILHTKGFETTTEFTAQGRCVEHEIDVTAWNEEKLVMIEAKFHNEFGLKSDLKTVLYVDSRWDDLREEEFDFGKKRKLDEGWLVTNTKFTDQAIKYAKCKKMKLVGWGYPQQGNLQDLIEETGLHPITVLNTLSNQEQRELMELGIIHIKQLKENPDIAKQAIKKDSDLEETLKEIDLILGT